MPSAPEVIPPPIDPAKTALLGLLRQVLLGLGVLLAGHGLIGPDNAVSADNWQFIVGAIMTLAPVAWSWWEKYAVAKDAKSRETIAVAAGMNLVTSGMALAVDGTTIKTSQSAPTLPVTAKSAAAIIEAHAPLPSPLGLTADDLNTAELARLRGTP